MPLALAQASTIVDVALETGREVGMGFGERTLAGRAPPEAAGLKADRASTGRASECAPLACAAPPADAGAQ